jgi:hypothetical protein
MTKTFMVAGISLLTLIAIGAGGLIKTLLMAVGVATIILVVVR